MLAMNNLHSNMDARMPHLESPSKKEHMPMNRLEKRGCEKKDKRGKRGLEEDESPPPSTRPLVEKDCFGWKNQIALCIRRCKGFGI